MSVHPSRYHAGLDEDIDLRWWHVFLRAIVGLFGLSVEEYPAAIDSGKKVNLPDPKGECDLSGTNLNRTTEALDRRFAQQAARQAFTLPSRQRRLFSKV